MIPSSHRGLIFALDAAIAVSVIVIVLLNTSYYFSTSQQDSLPHLQLVKTAGDIITIMDATGELDTAFLNNALQPAGPFAEIPVTDINLSLYLPRNYRMWLEMADMKETVCALPPCTGDFALTTLPLEKPQNALIQVNLSVIGSSPTLTINTTGPPLTITPLQSGIYTLGQFTFPVGPSSVNFQTNDIDVGWFKILGTAAYAGSTNETLVIPQSNFVGTGEQYFTVTKTANLSSGESPIEGIHRVRFKIWIEGEL